MGGAAGSAAAAWTGGGGTRVRNDGVREAWHDVNEALLSAGEARAALRRFWELNVPRYVVEESVRCAASAAAACIRPSTTRCTRRPFKGEEWEGDAEYDPAMGDADHDQARAFARCDVVRVYGS